MKKIIAILFLCVTGFACAQSVPAAEKNVSREHRGFYNSASFGFAYNFFDNSREDFDDYERDRKRHDIDYYEFNGFSFSHVELKFGYAFGNLLALHTVFNFGFYMGPLDDYDRSYLVTCYENMACIDVRKDEDEDDPSSSDGFSFRTYFGFGATLYPIQNKNSPFNGLFVGGSMGYTLFAAYGSGANTGNGGIGFQLEFGKEWWMNNHFSMGVGFGFAHSGLVWKTVDSHQSDNVLSLTIRLTRG